MWDKKLYHLWEWAAFSRSLFLDTVDWQPTSTLWSSHLPPPLNNEWSTAEEGVWWHISVGLLLLECRTPAHILACGLPICLPQTLLDWAVVWGSSYPSSFLSQSLSQVLDLHYLSLSLLLLFLPFLLSRLFFSRIFYMSNPTLVFCSWKGLWTNLETKG